MAFVTGRKLEKDQEAIALVQSNRQKAELKNARVDHPMVGSSYEDGSGMYAVGGMGLMDFGDDRLNATNRANNEVAKACIRQEFWDVQIENRKSGFTLSNGDQPILMNNINDFGGEAVYRKSEELLNLASANNGLIPAEALAGVTANQFTNGVGTAYLDIACYKAARGEVEVEDASLGFAQMNRNFNGNAFFAGETKIAGLFDEHYQAMDPKTRGSMDPAQREFALQQLARCEMMAGFSMADKNGNLRMAVAPGDEKFPEAHGSIITPQMAAENKERQEAIKTMDAVIQSDKAKEERKEAESKADSVSTGQVKNTAEPSKTAAASTEANMEKATETAKADPVVRQNNHMAPQTISAPPSAPTVSAPQAPSSGQSIG